VYTAQSIYGIAPQMPSAGVAAPTQQMGADFLPAGMRGLVDPGNPLFWVGAIMAVTFGLAGVAGSVRLGRAKLSASLEQT
jgi:hypothetical protein